ncbi:MAG: hypothetical protein DRN66_03450 [Candidatus Nanohalarchaeota archaeon]|nr:MAG: hypothetical protein DRN66_03450 [Candidatus Nanohaloarchaeota archaeon]
MIYGEIIWRGIIKIVDRNFEDVDLENRTAKNFKTHKIYFLRIVRRKGTKESDEEYGFINIMKHEIKLSKDLIHLFVFCVLDVKLKKITVNSELDDGLWKR